MMAILLSPKPDMTSKSSLLGGSATLGRSGSATATERRRKRQTSLDVLHQFDALSRDISLRASMISRE